MKEASRLITISDLSTRYGVTHRTLRFYEVCGLLSPLREGRQRLYSNDDGQTTVPPAMILVGLPSRAPLAWRTADAAFARSEISRGSFSARAA